MGKQVEVLTTDGRKLKGTLTAANAEEVILSIPTKVRIEGKKRPELQDVENKIPMAEVKSGRYLLECK